MYWLFFSMICFKTVFCVEYSNFWTYAQCSWMIFGQNMGNRNPGKNCHATIDATSVDITMSKFIVSTQLLHLFLPSHCDFWMLFWVFVAQILAQKLGKFKPFCQIIKCAFLHFANFFCNKHCEMCIITTFVQVKFLSVDAKMIANTLKWLNMACICKFLENLLQIIWRDVKIWQIIFFTSNFQKIQIAVCAESKKHSVFFFKQPFEPAIKMVKCWRRLKLFVGMSKFYIWIAYFAKFEWVIWVHQNVILFCILKVFVNNNIAKWAYVHSITALNVKKQVIQNILSVLIISQLWQFCNAIWRNKQIFRFLPTCYISSFQKCAMSCSKLPNTKKNGKFQWISANLWLLSINFSIFCVSTLSSKTIDIQFFLFMW